MDNLAKNGRVHEAKAVFDEMKGKNIRSDGYSYSIMISAFCRSGQVNEAKELAKEFEACYDKYDLVMLNTLLRAYCNSHDMESVMLILRKMDDLAVSPDWNTFQILLKYFFKEKLYHLAYQTVEDMYQKGYQLDEELCSSLLLHLAQSGASTEAFSIYTMLRYSKGTLHRPIHEKMLDILVEAKLFKNAYVVMKDNTKRISVRSLQNFGFQFMKSGNINMLNDVLKSLHLAGYKINQEMFNIAISRYIERPEKRELLLHLLQWMSGHGYMINSVTRNLLLKNPQLSGQKHLIADTLSKQKFSPVRPG